MSRKDLDYPIADQASWRRITAPPVAVRARAWMSDFGRKRPPSDPQIELTRHSGSFAPLAADDLPLICMVRDAGEYIGAFLRHYRGLGVTRFLFVDDNSEDGTRETLEAAGDVDLYTAAEPYEETVSKQRRDALTRIYGGERWYLSVDADEFLVYPDCEHRPLPGFIADLEAAGLRRCLAPMVDIYPPGPMTGERYVDDGKASPFDVSSHFDGSGYRVSATRHGVMITGGPRKRLFGLLNWLTKYPLIRVDSTTSFTQSNVHFPIPARQNFMPVLGVLLHYKFSATTGVRFRKIIAQSGQSNVNEYVTITRSDRFSDDMSLSYENSVRFTNSMDLVERGFMVDARDWANDGRQKK